MAGRARNGADGPVRSGGGLAAPLVGGGEVPAQVQWHGEATRALRTLERALEVRARATGSCRAAGRCRRHPPELLEELDLQPGRLVASGEQRLQRLLNCRHQGFSERIVGSFPDGSIRRARPDPCRLRTILAVMTPSILPFVHARGSWGEIGRQIGTMLAPAIERHVEAWIGHVIRETGCSRAEVLEAARPFASPIEQHAPFLWEELDGLAQGSRIGRTELL